MPTRWPNARVVAKMAAMLTMFAGAFSSAGESVDAGADQQASEATAVSESTDRADGAIALFNGKSLDGWTTGSGAPVTRGWEVQDGELVRAGRGGAIYTEDEYKDFILDFEWKIAPGVNSGIKYRIKYYEVGVFGRPGMLGCEYQIYDDARDPSPKTSAGALYALYAPNESKKLNPPGEYNKSRIVVSGTKMEHWLNGEKILEADTSSHDWRRRVAQSKFSRAEGFGENRRGRIEIQDHGGKVWFRSITLTPLSRSE